MKRLRTIIMIIALAVVCAPRVQAFSLALDSVRTWGRFPNFCVDVYRWGDRFFNTYDSAYVQGTGYKFNIKNRTETWGDRYAFTLPDNYQLEMASDLCTSTGFYLTYLAVSFGYDLNVSKWFGHRAPARDRFVFQFNCALFSVDLNWVSNNVGTRIREFGQRGETQRYDIPFEGINTDMFTVSAVYFLNHKKYSQAAAFNYSKVQKRNQGSFFVGFTYWTQNFQFDFRDLPDFMKSDLPVSWEEMDYRYQVKNRNYCLTGGYGYNWVFANHWVAGVSEMPIVGIKDGFANGETERKLSFSMYNRFRASVVWNNGHWFAGGIVKVENGLIYDKDHTLLNTVLNGEISVGYRFNLW